MASVEANLETIRTAVYGRDMRQAIYELFRYVTDTYETSAYIKGALMGFPQLTLTNILDTVTTSSTLYGASPYYNIPDSRFDCENDALLVWRNDNQLIPKSYYTFDTTTVIGFVKIDFNLPNFFDDGDRMMFSVYKVAQSAPPRTQGVTQQLLTGTQTGYSAGIAYPVNDEIIDGEVWQ